MADHDGKPRFRNGRVPGERSTAAGEHVPVMLAECLAAMNVRPGQTVVDCTLGFGGHSVELLKLVGPTGHVFACDLDGENMAAVEPKLAAVGHPFTLHHGNFAGVGNALAAHGVGGVDAVLADLGFSSMQVDDADRGFSFMRDGPLDMRMDRTRGTTAADVINTLPLDELKAALRDLGDAPEDEADKIVFAIHAARSKKPFSRTRELRDVIRYGAPVRSVRGPGAPPERKQLLLPTTRVFQTLRMLVNRETANLQQLLRVLPGVLKPGGVAAVISFHSGEDRLVKIAFRDGQRAGQYDAVVGDAIRPGEAEKSANPRSRSAKLRWARRAT